MDTIPFLLIIFITFLITSITFFSINSGFGTNSSKFMDPFEGHEAKK